MTLFPSVAFLSNFCISLHVIRPWLLLPLMHLVIPLQGHRKGLQRKGIPTSNPCFFYFHQLVIENKTHICISRSNPSPTKEVAKKLFTGEETTDGSGGSDSGAATSDQNRCLATFIHLLLVTDQSSVQLLQLRCLLHSYSQIGSVIPAESDVA